MWDLQTIARLNSAKCQELLVARLCDALRSSGICVDERVRQRVITFARNLPVQEERRAVS